MDTKMKIKIHAGETLRIGDGVVIEVESLTMDRNRRAAYLLVTAPQGLRFSGTCLPARESEENKDAQ